MCRLKFTYKIVKLNSALGYSENMKKKPFLLSVFFFKLLWVRTYINPFGPVIYLFFRRFPFIRSTTRYYYIVVPQKWEWYRYYRLFWTISNTVFAFFPPIYTHIIYVWTCPRSNPLRSSRILLPPSKKTNVNIGRNTSVFKFHPLLLFHFLFIRWTRILDKVAVIWAWEYGRKRLYGQYI